MATQIQNKVPAVRPLPGGSSTASGSAGPGTSVPPPTVQEFSIKVPKNPRKKYHMMRFNSTLNVDFSKWSQVKMERENNSREYKSTEDEMPKFGAGSEFGREAREEARRKKFGIIARKYRPEDQPWILKAGGKNGKKFKGIREGGVSENAGYYVFMKVDDGVIEAYPLQEWYKFQPIQRYKALSAEEAEEEFGRRNKQQNFFSLMMRKRLRPDEDLDLDDPDEAKGKRKGSGTKKTKELKISDMEEWMNSEDESDSDEGEEKEEDKEEKAQKKKKGKKEAEAKKKKKKKDSDDEAFEESDDGDEEGREFDYDSDSSLSVSDHDEKAKNEMKGVAEEDALRKLLTSDEEEEEDEEKKKEKEENSENEEKKEGDEAKKDSTDSKKISNEKDRKKSKKRKREADSPPSPPGGKSADKAQDKKDKNNDSMSDLTDSSDSDSGKKKDKKEVRDNNSENNSRSASPALGPDLKRKATSDVLASVAAKKAKLDNLAAASSSSYIAGASEAGITEDAVRRYLMRKPMTTTDLVQKFKSKKIGLSSDQLLAVMTQILKRINPVKQHIKGKLYLSIKASHSSAPKLTENS